MQRGTPSRRLPHPLRGFPPPLLSSTPQPTSAPSPLCCYPPLPACVAKGVTMVDGVPRVAVPSRLSTTLCVDTSATSTLASGGQQISRCVFKMTLQVESEQHSLLVLAIMCVTCSYCNPM